MLRSNFRSINIFKNNEEGTGARLGLFFDKHECFHELPPVEEEEKLQVIYQNVIEKEKLKKQRFINRDLFGG